MSFKKQISIETSNGRLTVHEDDVSVVVKYSDHTGTRGHQLWAMQFEQLYEALIKLGLPLVHLAQKGSIL